MQPIPGPAGTLFINDGGSREAVPVVFMHAYAGNNAHWSAQLEHLRKSRRAIAFDFRGHGESSPPADLAYSSEALSGDIAAVVDTLALSRFVLVGHSQGASAAIAYAGANSQRVAGLVLVGAPGKVPAEQAQKIMASLEANYDQVMADYWNKLLSGARPEVRARLQREKDSIPKDASLALIKGLFADDPVRGLLRYPGPTLIIATSHNDQPYDLQRLLPQVPAQTITGTSHWPHLDKPDEFNLVLDAFLATIK